MKQNTITTITQICRRLVAFGLAAVLLISTTPLMTFASAAEEPVSVAEQSAALVEENVPGTENTEPVAGEIATVPETTESVPEETVAETETTESATEEPVTEPENTEAVVEETAAEAEATEPVAEETVTESEAAESADEETMAEADPYELVSAAAEGYIEITQPDQLANGVPAGGTYVLKNDIQMGDGQQIGVVAGTLDGAGHTITLGGKALVRELTGTIQNLMVAGKATLDNGEGSIACTVKGGSILNCGSTVAIDPGWAFNLGGLAGNVENGKIYNSFFAGSGRDMFDTVAINGIFYISGNSDAPSKIDNCYYTEGLTLGSGSAWNRDHTNSGKKSLDQMKTPEFVQLLNASNVGSGYIWEAVGGSLPRLVSGGGELETCDKTALGAAMQEAQGKNESDYTNDTWAAMQEALTAAQAVYEKIDAKQEDVDEAATALQNAIAALKEKVRDLSPVEPPKEGVIPVSSQEELAKIDGNNSQAFYQLTQDIVIEGNFWSPNLAGVLDGNGHTITICIASPLFSSITETGVVQNLRVKVEGNFTNRQQFAPFADTLKGGMIVNCISEVTGQHSAGYVRRMEDGVMVNCLTMGHNRRGALVYFQKSTDHQNINGYKKGKFYNCYWSASNSVENIDPAENLIRCEPVGDERLRSAEFIAQLNNQKGEFGSTWGRGSNGYPYFGADQGDHVIDGSENRYTVQFVWHDQRSMDVEDGNLMLSPQMTNSTRFAGTFRLKGVPQDSTIRWSCEDRANQEIMQLSENGELFVFQDGGGVVRAVEQKADGTEELAAEIRVVSASRKIEQLRLLLDGAVIEDAATVQGSAVTELEIQAKYTDADAFQPLPAYLVELQSEKPELLRTDYNTAAFYFKQPGTSKLTVTEKTNRENPVSVTVSITSEYVPVQRIEPAISDTVEIHYRNSMGSGQFISLPQTVFVEPSNASYKDDVTVESSDPSIAQFDGSGYVPYQNGTVTFTAKLRDRDTVVEGKSSVTFVYANSLTEVAASEKTITLDQREKQTLPLIFHGEPGNLHEITEPNLVWTFDQPGIVSIQRPDPLTQIRGTGGPDDGNWVASSKFEVKGLRPGTVVATGTPVDTTGGASPVQLTITVTGDGSTVQGFDIPQFIETGKQTASRYLNAHNTFSFGEEWTIFTLLRDGQTLSQDQLNRYYDDVMTNVRSWKPNVLATDVERTAIALSAMGKDITNVEGVNFVKLICNHPNLTRQGSNSLAWALLALDMNETPIPADMKWSRERMVAELLTYQNRDGGFGLDKSGTSGIDMTAMSLQALARYQKQGEVADAIERGVRYLAAAAERNLNLGSSESISQVIITLAVLNRDIVEEPGFGDEMENIMSALSTYLVEGEGFRHNKNGAVDKMATAQAMQALCAYERFLNGESSYWDLKGTGPIEDPAEKVSSMIADLPETIRAEDAQDVQAVRDAYEALTEAQKGRVKNLKKLKKAEKALAELLEVQQVIDAIDALPNEITLADADRVRIAREAYDRLSRKQQAQVTNFEKLKAAEDSLKKLATPDSVMKMIEELPEHITLDDQEAVRAARAAYEMLPWIQQIQVKNLEKLKNAEKQLEELLSTQQVQQVIDAIAELPEMVTLDDEAAVQAARNAYDQLNQAQKKQVSNVDKLLQAEQAIADQKAAQKVDKAIQMLPESVSLGDQKAVQEARSAYEALSDEQKALVKNLEKLTRAEADLKDLEAAQEVMGMINALPVNASVADEQAVQNARSAYQALTETQQKLVLNLYLLERAEQCVAEQKAVQTVESAIAALPKKISKDDAQAVKAARAAYNQLSPEQRKLVGNVEKLIRAEKALKALRKPGGAHETGSNVVTAKVENEIVSANQLAEIQGKDLILRIEGTMENGEHYVLSIHGKDIAKAEDIVVGMKRKGLYEADIHKLSEDPEVFRFVETGAFPGPMMVEMDTAMEDGEYLLMHYDPSEQRASLVSRVQVENGSVQFIVQEGGEYFLTKKVSTKSVPELEAANNMSADGNPEQLTVEEMTQTAETVPTVSQERSSGFVYLPLLLLAVGGVLIALKKRKENKDE